MQNEPASEGQKLGNDELKRNWISMLNQMIINIDGIDTSKATYEDMLQELYALIDGFNQVAEMAEDCLKYKREQTGKVGS